MQGRRNDFQIGGAWSLSLRIISGSYLSVLAIASFSKLLKYEQMRNGLSWHFLLEKLCKKMINTNLCRKIEGPMIPAINIPTLGSISILGTYK